MNEDKINILNFIGFKRYDYNTYYNPKTTGNYKHLINIDFETDWEWLMLAVSNIIDMGYEYKVGQINNMYFAGFFEKDEQIISSVENSIKKATYELVLEISEHFSKDKKINLIK